MSLAKGIKMYRKQKGMSQMELAKAAEIGQPYLCQLERGSRTPTVPTALQIAKVLGVTLNELLAAGED